MRCVISNREGQTLINVPIDIRRGLYFIDIKYFLNANDNFVNSVRSAVTNLHNRLHHAASPAVMATALRLGPGLRWIYCMPLLRAFIDIKIAWLVCWESQIVFHMLQVRWTLSIHWWMCIVRLQICFSEVSFKYIPSRRLHRVSWRRDVRQFILQDKERFFQNLNFSHLSSMRMDRSLQQKFPSGQEDFWVMHRSREG
jgi:hypothetical protein